MLKQTNKHRHTQIIYEINAAFISRGVVFNSFSFKKKEVQLDAIVNLTSCVGMLRFLAFDVFSNQELLYFVNGNTSIKNSAIKRMMPFVSKDYIRERYKNDKSEIFCGKIWG